MKKNYLILGFSVLLFSCNYENVNVDLNTQVDSVSYSLGISVAENLTNSGFENLNTKAFQLGFQDVLSSNDVKINQQNANIIIQEYLTELTTQKNTFAIEEGKKFLEENSKKTGVVTTSTGLQYEILVDSDGPKPKASDNVTVHYHGTLIDGTIFDSSVDRGEPVNFPVNGVIAGWVEALQLMSVGSKFKLFIPSNLAYGERGSGPIGPSSTLIFEVELLSIN